LSAPSFDVCRFAVAAGKPTKLSIAMKY